MALLRIIHAASLPDPSELARMFSEGPPAAHAASVASDGAASHTAPAQPSSELPATFPGLIKLLEHRSQYRLANDLHDCAALVTYDPPELVVRLTHPLRAEFAGELAAALQSATGSRWSVTLSEAPGEPTLREQEQAQEDEARQAILDTPVLKATKEAFPNAELEWPIDETAKWSESA